LLLLFACGGSREKREAEQLARFPEGEIVEDGFGPGSADDLDRPPNLRLIGPVLGRGVCVTRYDMPVQGGFGSPRWGIWTYEYVRTTQKTGADGQVLTCFTGIESSSLGLESQGEYQDDHHVGEWTYWHPNGVKRASGPFVGGRVSGPWSFWMPDGAPDSDLSGVYAENKRLSASAR